MRSEMDKIQLTLKDYFDVDSEVDTSGTYLRGNTELMVILITAPEDGEGKWELRMSPAASFDRWSNSMCIQEFFSSGPMLRTYFYRHRYDIWKMLLKALSEEYEELRDEFDNERED